MFARSWLIAGLVVLGLGGGCSQFNTNLTIQTSSSTLTFLSPQTANAGDSDFTITATGAGFVSGAIILWNVGPNQSQLTTTFISSTQLTATVPASNVAAAGNIHVAVQILGSAVSGASGTNATTTTEVSDVVNFMIQPKPGPAPVMTSLSASATSMASTPYCSPTGFTLTVTGSNFDSASVVNWNGSPRTTTFGNSGQLTASILPQDAAFPGTASVSVSSVSGTSNSVLFTMTTPGPTTNLPAPSISMVSPTSFPAESPTFTLTVTGASFVPCSVVRWDGVVKATTYVSATQLNATIPAADVFTAGPGNVSRTVNITVFTLAPGGGNSGASTFTITPFVP
jgi:hypothetical protein